MNSSKFKVVLAPTAELGETVKAEITIEAEYGEEVVEGSRYTAAHHGPRSGNPAPCVDENIPGIGDGETILVSHLDLDTLGGIARAIGHVTSDRKDFWSLAAYVDVNGPHTLASAGTSCRGSLRASASDIADLHAYWAWSANARAPRLNPKATHDVTAEVLRHLGILIDIFDENKQQVPFVSTPLHDAGAAFKAAEAKLNEESFVEIDAAAYQRLVIRFSPGFVNHLYTSPSGEVGDAVVGFNTKTGAITLSFADAGRIGEDACEIMQKVLGPTAGGHKGIAGSPRGERQNLDSLMAVVKLVRHRLWRCPECGEPDGWCLTSCSKQ